MIGVFALLIGVWVVVFWIYEPPKKPEGEVFFADRPVAVAVDVPGMPGDAPAATPQPIGGARSGAGGTQGGSGRGVVVAPQFDEYTVRSGDVSFERIALRVYGDASLGAVISSANPFVSPHKLIPGRTKLRIPRDPKNVQGVVVEAPAAPVNAQEQPPRPAPGAGQPADQGRVYVVAPNDTLSEISKKVYGRAGLWRRIYEANRGVIPDPDRLKVGTRLTIPPVGG
ncbi:MAG: hypothetical protein C0513_00135 [Isosphaera sp.]|nr:hypothetical protein [Isosphaera sp.]